MVASRVIPPGLCLLAAVALSACSQASDAPASDPTGNLIPLPSPRGDLDNLLIVDSRLISGAAPDGDASFDALAAMGVRTVISVDGARPDVERARARGMRYVHIPIGYDGFDESDARRIALAVRDLPGPVYVHCHHGVHRGPAMVAAAQVGLGRWTNDEALTFMEEAGTSHSYPGLYECAAATKPIAADAPALAQSELPEIAIVSGLVAGMSAIDKTWERLGDIRDANWTTPDDHPDLVPAAEAGMLADLFRTLADDPEVIALGSELRSWMSESGTTAGALELLLLSGDVDVDSAAAQFEGIQIRCSSCHATYRN